MGEKTQTGRMDLQCGKGLGGNSGLFDIRDENENKDKRVVRKSFAILKLMTFSNVRDSYVLFRVSQPQHY